MSSSRLFGLLGSVGVAWILVASQIEAATNAFPVRVRSGVSTNATPKLAGTARTNTVATVPGKRTGTNANAATLGSTNRTERLIETFRGWQASPAFYPTLIGVAMCVALVFLIRSFRQKSRPVGKAEAPLASSKLGAKSSRAGAVRAVQSCNVLEIGPQARQLWQFDARGAGFVLNREQTCADGEALPAHIVTKDWRSWFQRKLNIAWLPPEHVFLRVTHIPRSDFDETLAMVELQLEKLSPLPVAQVTWSVQILPHAEDNLQTVVVMMVERSVVEEFLGRLEGQGFLADRLELPLLDQLQSTPAEDGAWIYPEAAGGKNTALVAWWSKGVLQSLGLITLPPANRPAALKEQLVQMAWAGELEGWLSGSPQWHLVADVSAAEWEPALREGLETRIDIIAPRPARELAALTARRSAQTEDRANLMPTEFTTRYQQQFVDRLWMRGLVALGAVYLLGVAVYMGNLAYATLRTDSVEDEVARLGPTYTNAIQLRDRFKVLKERQELKYAGLDCWSTTALLLRENMTLDSMNFSEGRRLNLQGTAPGDQTKELYQFEGEMRKATIRGQPLFDANRGESIQFRVQGPTLSWTLSLELNRSEVQ